VYKADGKANLSIAELIPSVVPFLVHEPVQVNLCAAQYILSATLLLDILHI
jgi:hypothetical protein